MVYLYMYIKKYSAYLPVEMIDQPMNELVMQIHVHFCGVYLI